MFRIRLRTASYRPDQVVTIRTGCCDPVIDRATRLLVEDEQTKERHKHPLETSREVCGRQYGDQWLFELDEANFPSRPFKFKFILERSYRMTGGLLELQPKDRDENVFEDEYVFEEGIDRPDSRKVSFPPRNEMVVECGTVQKRLFGQPRDEPRTFDAIVIGSGMGGGILAEQLSDLGKNVLVLEAGSYLFPVHVANLPRQHYVGTFQKHVWHLWDEFEVHNYTNAPNSAYRGGQGFNLGGRSIFWGGLIPRMTWWELDSWPRQIRWYLEDRGYRRAEELMNRTPPNPTVYQRRVKDFLYEKFPKLDHYDAPIGLQAITLDGGTIPAGLFSTADLLMESVLTGGGAGNAHLFVKLNHRVLRLETRWGKVTRVVAHDLIADEVRTFEAKVVILAAGSVESVMVARRSYLEDPSGKLGVGLTDHPIFYTHFAIPSTSPWYNVDGACKILSQYRRPGDPADRSNRKTIKYPFNVVLELGADFLQGRFVDRDILRLQQQMKSDQPDRPGQMLCEVVFQFNSPLVNANRVQATDASGAKPLVKMKRSDCANSFRDEVCRLKDEIIGAFEGCQLEGDKEDDSLELHEADLGAAGHEAGTMRLGIDSDLGDVPESVVDTDLKLRAYDNLYACDLSVFPSCPAANPSLTLAALAIRLADHLSERL